MTYDENGKRKPKWIATGLEIKGNKRKAEEKRKEIEREYELKRKRALGNTIGNSIGFKTVV